MDAREQHVVAPAEDLRGAVAVVDVPVEYEHALHPVLADRQLGGDRHIVEQAEAHRAVAFGVVAGGPYSAEAHRRLAGEQRLRHRAAPPAACSAAR